MFESFVCVCLRVKIQEIADWQIEVINLTKCQDFTLFLCLLLLLVRMLQKELINLVYIAEFM